MEKIEFATFSFFDFINSKPLFYEIIDYERFPKIWKKIKDKFIKPKKLIHIVGTNGKGSTGRFLAHYLHKMGLNVIHYSSPHILEFNERIWINGKNVSNETLELTHKNLLADINKNDLELLSYFEYTTLIAYKLSSNFDFAIFEAGLGGEFDATNQFPKDLSLITTIGFDHEQFLGNTINQIATTKLNSIDKFAIFGYQEFSEVLEISNKVFNYLDFFNSDELVLIDNFTEKSNLAPFLSNNLKLALSAIKFFSLEFNLNHLNGLTIFGRFSQIAPNITIDVGHNPLGAKAIKSSLGDKKVVLIYNTLKDKNYLEILNILKPNLDSIEIIKIENDRAINLEQLKSEIKNIGLRVSEFSKIDKAKEYLVFGSFSVVETFLKWLKREDYEYFR